MSLNGGSPANGGSGSDAGATSGQDAGVAELVRRALAEDLGDGDWTTLWTVDGDLERDAVIVAKEALVVSGTRPAVEVFQAVDPDLNVLVDLADGASARPGDTVLSLSGKARSILTAERTALNFLGRLSGIATATRRFAQAVEGTGARIIDTRKTTPGLRLLEKEAVRHGGGTNHRVGLFDMVLIKDNHIAAAGGIREAVDRVRASNERDLEVEVEVTDLDQLAQALDCGVGRILLDNMDPEGLRRAVAAVEAWSGPRPVLEASGNVTLATVRAVAETGVDLISVGALTHSAPTADLSLRISLG
jgi:nicotinate-nucleotide pyrophosphorylase (carboxylating)